MPSNRWLETFSTRLANIDGFRFEIEGFHLDGQVVYIEIVVKLAANHGQKLRVRHRIVVADVR